MSAALQKEEEASPQEVAEATQSRFRILKTDGVIQLHGVLTDNVNLLALSELISKKTEPIDMSQLARATWNGLLTLNAKLREIYGSQQIVIRGVPFGVYRHLKLLPEFRTYYQVESMEMGFLSIGGDDNAQIRIKKAMVDTKDLRDIAEASVKGFAVDSRKSDLGRVFGRLDFAVPTDVSTDSQLQDGIQGAMPAEEDFWYRYFSFATTSMSLSEDLSDSLGRAVSGLLREITLELQGLERGMTILDSQYQCHPDATSDKAGSLFLKGAKVLSDSITVTTAACDVAMGEMENLFADSSGSRSVKDVREACAKVCHAILSARSYLGEIENLGVILSDKLMGVNSVLVKGKQITKGQDNVEGDQLVSFREALDIMDPLSEDDWAATLEIALERITLIDDHSSKAITLLQGFDLLRQILEHRISEAEKIISGFDANLSWEDIKKSVYEMVRKKLVTDQEKYAAEFFTPEAATVQEDDESKKPGDMLFF